MIDEQIIDVCPYQGECSVSGCKRNDDNCFVRQLFEERNKAENQIVDLNKMVETKEQECEILKKKLDIALRNNTNITHLKLDKVDLQSELDQLEAQLLDQEAETLKAGGIIHKLEKTLTEIKEIVKKEIVCDDCNFQGTDKCDSRLCTSFYLDDFCKSLLQKISEVIPDEKV